MSAFDAQQTLTQAVAHHQTGHLADAERLYRLILARNPDEPDTLHLLGVLLGQSGQLDAAIELVSRAVALRPADANFHANLGGLYQRQRKIDLAIASLQRAVQLNPLLSDAHYNLSLALKDHGRPQQAAPAFARAMEQNPAFADACGPIMFALRNARRFDQAVALGERAVQLKPDSAAAHRALGMALIDKGAFAQAVAVHQRAVTLAPNIADVHNELATALRSVGRLQEAIDALQAALRLEPSPGAWNNLGIPLQELSRFDEAIACYRKAIALQPDNAAAHVNLALLLLSMAQFDQGWTEFEWRLKMPDLLNDRHFSQPQWNGSDLTGKTILLHAEGGHGDAINFVRYLPMLAARGAKIILECHPGLIPLFAELPNVDHLIPRGQPLPSFDCHIPLPSFPGVFRSNLENIPNSVPYLTIPDEYRRRWSGRRPRDGKLNVGLSWCGAKYRKPGSDPRTRTLDAFAPLAQIPGIRLFTLQIGPESSQPHPPGLELIDLTADLKDFADTAALMENLDLVITVDTSIAHLAGALARPVWVLIPFPPDFRWLLDRTDSPWYPTMRLFRQPKRGDWQTPLTQLFEELCRLETSRKS